MRENHGLRRLRGRIDLRAVQRLIASMFGYSRQPYGLENDILDTFEAFSPRYHGTHPPEEVAWFRAAALGDVREASAIRTSMRGTLL